MAKLDRSLLAGLPAFEGLRDEELAEIVRQARPVRYPKESTIFEQAAEAHSFFLLLDGHVRVVRTTPDGTQVIARYISEGELLGIAAALGRDTYPASAIAAVDCVVLAWPSALWPEFTARFPAFGAGAYRTVGARLEDTQARVVEMSTERVEQRIAHALLRLVNQSGRKTEEGIEIDFPLSREDVAEMTGTTLHTASRLLSKWESEGLVTGGRQRIIVKDPHALFLIAENRRKP